MKIGKPRILVFASGGVEPDDGGGGVRELFEYSQLGHPGINFEIVGVVSNREKGGVWKKMNDMGAGHLFEFAPGPFDDKFYTGLVEKYKPDVVMLSGWLKRVVGEVLSVMKGKIINIHPALLPLTGGTYGHLAHERVIESFRAGEIKYTEFMIHFVDESWDNENLACMRHRVLIRKEDTAESIAARVNEKERAWQAYVLSFVANGQIRLDEKNHVHFENETVKKLLLL